MSECWQGGFNDEQMTLEIDWKGECIPITFLSTELEISYFRSDSEDVNFDSVS